MKTHEAARAVHAEMQAPFTLHDIWTRFGRAAYRDRLNNCIEIQGEMTERAESNLKRVVVRQWVGGSNRLTFTSLDFDLTQHLHLYMTYGSSIRVGRLLLMSQLTIFAGDHADVTIGDDCMFASEFEILASNVPTRTSAS